MATMKQVYVASDGEPFETETEADAHDAALADKKALDDYIAKANLPGNVAGALRGHFAAFKLFQTQGVDPAIYVKKERAPKTTAAAAT